MSTGYGGSTVNDTPGISVLAEVEAFLTHLAARDQVSASIQNQAKNAIRFLFREMSIVSCHGWTESWERGASQRLPVVLTLEEVEAVGTHARHVRSRGKALIWLRVEDPGVPETRVQDIDFTRHESLMRDGKAPRLA